MHWWHRHLGTDSRKKNCCSFGFCPNEGGSAVPNFFCTFAFSCKVHFWSIKGVYLNQNANNLNWAVSFCESVPKGSRLMERLHITLFSKYHNGLYVTLPQDGAAFSAWWPPWPSWAGARPMSKTWIVQSISFLFCIYCRTKYVQKYNISDTKLLSRYYSPYFVIFTVHEPVRAVKSEDRNWWW